MLNKKAIAATAAGVETDEDFNQTVLLLHGDGTNGAQNNTFTDSSTNNFTITRNGNTTQGTFSPFSQTGWSNYFDGTGDYLSIANNSAFDFGTGNFTVEFWLNFQNSSGAQTVFDINYTTASNLLFQASSGAMAVYMNGASTILSTSAVSNGTWNHFALVRNGTTVTLYLNGVSASSATYSGNVGNSSSTVYVGGSTGGGGYYVNGYLSNFRVVKGTAVYTSAFTPPTAALTAITNTSLLTCQSNRFVDKSSNAFTITANGNASVQAFSPFAPSAAYDAATNGGSGYFDGSGDYLETPSSSVFTLGSSGDFTVECWAYLNGSQSASYAALMTSMASFSNGYTNRWAFTVDGVSLRWYDSSGNVGVSTNLKAYEWTHIAAVRSGSTITLYVNGTSVGTQTSNQSYTTEGSVKIGYLASAAYFNGYISDARVVKGTAIYTSNFTPPTAPLSAVGNTQLLCNFQNAGIIDSTAKNVLETVGNAQIDTGTKKFGTGSLEFDGTGDYLTVRSGPWLQFGKDFTLECWIYPTSSASNQMIFSSVDYWRNSLGLQLLTNRTIKFVMCDVESSSGVYDEVTTSSTVSLNAWSHIAVVRYNGTLSVYINGTSGGSTSSTRINYIPTGLTAIASDGGSYLNSSLYTGFIDDLRITKGVARYTANFTAPTKAFPDQ